MSKMKMPEMSVVRFEESDILCASGSGYLPTAVVFHNFADTGKGNGSVTFNNRTYSFTPHDGQGSIYNTFLNYAPYANYGVGSDNGWYEFSTLLSAETTGGTSSTAVPNGTYTWDSENNKYRLQ